MAQTEEDGYFPSHLVDVVAFFGPLWTGVTLKTRFGLLEGPDFLAARLAIIPILCTTATPFAPSALKTANRRKLASAAALEERINRNIAEHINDIIWYIAYVCIYGTGYFTLFTHASRLSTVACGLAGAAASIILYQAYRLVLLPPVDYAVRDSVQTDIDWVVSRWVAFVGLIGGTYAESAIRSQVSGLPTIAYLIEAKEFHSVFAFFGMIAPSVWFWGMKKCHTSNGAFLNSLQDDLGTLATAVLCACLWTLGSVSLLSVLWPVCSARRIFGTALALLSTGVLFWRPSVDPKSAISVLEPQRKDDGKSRCKTSPNECSWDWRSLCCGNHSSLRIIFALYWIVVVTSVLTAGVMSQQNVFEA